MATAAQVETQGASTAGLGDWPRTTRILPWLAAAAVATVLLVPIDSITLPVPLPFDARPDRVLLAACFGLWVLVVAVRAPARPEGTGFRFGAIEALLALFFCLAVMSVALNAGMLASLDETSLAVRKLLLLASYLGFYLLIVGTIRRSELPAFVRFVVAIGGIAAVGTIIEYAVGINLFFKLAGWLSPPGTSIASDALLKAPNGRLDVTGPARHGLADSTMLAVILPLALVGTVFAQGRRERILYGVVAGLMFVGCVTTFRRSGVILPFLACTAVIFGGGRRMIPLAATFVVLLAITPIVAPGVVDEVVGQFSSTNALTQASTEARTSDYAAVAPDIRAEAVNGRGFGSYDARRYRFIDNEYIVLAIETGVVGLGTYLALLFAAGGMALRTGLQRAGPASWIGLAVFGSVLAFIVANALFDALAFPQAPYAFLLVVALAGIARQAAEDEGDQAPGLAL